MFREAIITHPVVVNDGKPFEAYRAEVYRYGRGVYLSLRTQMYVKENLVVIGVPKNGVFSYKDDHIHRCVSVLQYQVAQALNPPIKVTQEVLDAMDKVPEAKFVILEAGLLPQLFRKRVACKTKKEGGTEWIYGKIYYYDSWVDGVEKELRIDYDYIKASDDCPLALQVLLGFTTKGVPVND